MTNIHLQIISPSHVIFDRKVKTVILPGAEGEFGVLYGHENLVAAIRPGLVDVRIGGAGTTSHFYIVSAGIAQVQKDHCAILVDYGTSLEECENRQNIAENIQKLKEELANASSRHRCEILQSKIDYFEVMLKLCKN